jgi:hypothetical protein
MLKLNLHKHLAMALSSIPFFAFGVLGCYFAYKIGMHLYNYIEINSLIQSICWLALLLVDAIFSTVFLVFGIVAVSVAFDE